MKQLFALLSACYNTDKSPIGRIKDMKRTIAALCCLLLAVSLLITSADAASDWTDIQDVVCLVGKTIALRGDGRVLYAGDLPAAAAQALSGWRDIRRIELQGNDCYLVGYDSAGRVFLALLDENGFVGRFEQSDVSGWSGVRKVVLRGDCCFALHNDGHLSWVVCGNEAAEIAHKTDGWPALSDIALDGYSLVVGLTPDGSVVATDYNALVETGSYWGTGPARLSDWTDIKQIYCEQSCVYGVKQNSVVGMNRPGWDKVSALYSQADSLFGLRSDGRVAANFCEYYDTDARLQQIGTWRDIVQLGFDGMIRYVPVGLRRDGTIAAVSTYDGSEPYGEWIFNGWSGVKQLFSGQDYTIGLRQDGTLLVTGGEFGTVDYLRAVSTWDHVRCIYAAHGEYTDHIVALRTDGTLVAAGDNSLGQCRVN